MLETLRAKDANEPNPAKRLFPDVVMVDGNGILHHQSFGLACHIGVRCNVATIGIGKKLLLLTDGLDDHAVKKDFLDKKCNEKARSFVPLQGQSGKVYGVALATVAGLSNPVYVSQGHNITLDSAIDLVCACAR